MHVYTLTEAQLRSLLCAYATFSVHYTASPGVLQSLDKQYTRHLADTPFEQVAQATQALATLVGKSHHVPDAAIATAHMEYATYHMDQKGPDGVDAASLAMHVTAIAAICTALRSESGGMGPSTGGATERPAS